MHAVFQCICIGVAYVAPFYLKGHRARNDPSVIKFRTASTVATCLLAWLPLYQQLQVIDFNIVDIEST